MKKARHIGIPTLFLTVVLIMTCLLSSCRPKDNNAATLEGLFDENGTALSYDKYGEQSTEVKKSKKIPQPIENYGSDKGDTNE